MQMSDPPASESLLKAALVRRAMTDVTRIIRLREDKPALQNLLQKGSIGDDLWNSLLAAEKEMEAEILEVAAEANAYVEGWGSVIFQTATEMMHNEKMRALVEQIPSIRAEAGAYHLSKTLEHSSLTLSRRAQVRQVSPSKVHRRSPFACTCHPRTFNSTARRITVPALDTLRPCASRDALFCQIVQRTGITQCRRRQRCIQRQRRVRLDANVTTLSVEIREPAVIWS